MWLLRQAHGMIPMPHLEPLHILDIAEQNVLSIKIEENTRLSDLVAAQRRLHGEGHIHIFEDLYGRVSPDYFINRGPIAGNFVMTTQAKRRRRTRGTNMIQITILNKLIDGEVMQHTKDFVSGVFVFEIFYSLPNKPIIHYANIMDSEGNQWRADDRVWASVTFTEYKLHNKLRGNGSTAVVGTGDATLDWFGRHLVKLQEEVKDTWIPARHLTQLVTTGIDQFLQHWLVGALHGTLRGVIAIQNHWTLLELLVHGDVLYVLHWDSLYQANKHLILQFTEEVKKILALKTYVLEYGS